MEADTAVTQSPLLTALALLLAVAFVGLAVFNIRRALFAYVVLGCVPFLKIISLSGSEVQQAILPVEAMASVLIAVWWLFYRPHTGRPLVTQGFEKPLLLLIPVSLLSIVSGFLWPDPAIAEDHMKLTVSLGQVMLIVWPVGTYLVASHSVDSTKWIRRVQQTILVLALPAITLPFLPEAAQPYWPYLVLSVYFNLAAAPFCFARVFSETSPFKRILLLAVALSPLLYGISIGKAFLYAYVVISVGTILLFRARTLLIGLLPLAVGGYLLLVSPGTAHLVPEPIQKLLDTERAQQSWGGKSGRVQLAIDAAGIWSRYPVLGVGAGNSWPYMNRYSAIDTPHNQYMNILLEMGIAGLFCFVLFIWKAFWTGVEVFKTARDPFHQSFALGWLGLFAGMAIGSLTGDFMLPSIRNGGLEMFSGFYLQWVLLGILVAIKRIESKKGRLARAA